MKIKTVFIIFILCVLAYAPTLTQPLMEDDYHNISLGRAYGPISGWDEMFADDVNRVRMTSWLMMYTADQMFGVTPLPLYSLNIFLHFLCCLLIICEWAMGTFRLSH